MAIGIFWIDPVTNRTSYDIQTAKAYIQNANGTSTPLEEKKGFLNVSDINRIENNLKFLSNVLETTIISKEWKTSDIPTAIDKERLLRNMENIINASEDYFEGASPPIVPEDLKRFDDFNNLEKAMQSVYNVLLEPLYTENGKMFALENDSVLAVRRSIRSG